MTRYRRLLTAVASLLFASTIATGSADARGNEQRTKPPASTGSEALEPGQANSPGRKNAGTTRANETVSPGTKDRDDDDAGRHGAAERKIALEERKYRERKAKVKRLRELATAQGNQQRLAALDKLEQKLTANHERKMKTWRARLGDETFKSIDERMKRGRGHAKGKGNAKRSAGKTGTTDSARGSKAGQGTGDADTLGQGRGNANAAGKSNARSGGKGNANAGGKGNSGPAGKGNANAGGKGNSEPAGKGNANAGGKGNSEPAGKGNANNKGKGKGNDAKRSKGNANAKRRGNPSKKGNTGGG